MSTHDASCALRLWVFRAKIWHPICRKIGHHGSWEDFNQTNLDDFSARIFANFVIFGFSHFICLHSYFNLAASRSTHAASSDHRGSIWRQLGSPGTMFDFSKIQKSWTIDFWVSPVTVSDETRGNRCGIVSRTFCSHRLRILNVVLLLPRRGRNFLTIPCIHGYIHVNMHRYIPWYLHD